MKGSDYRERRVRTVKKLLELLRHKRQKSMIFRGHSDVNYKLDPSVFRDNVMLVDDEEERLKREKAMLRSFKKWARPFLADRPGFYDDWRWLALARHYELPTRLLDWSENAGVALYFAVHRNKDKSSALWCSGRPEEVTSDNPSPFDIDNIVLYEPPYIATRISAQRSCFTVHPTDYKKEFRKWPRNLEKWIIPRALKQPIQDLLSDFGINKMTLFPGPSGVAEQLRNTYA